MDLQITKTDVGFVVSALTTIVGAIANVKFDPTVGATLAAIGVIATSAFGYLKARGADRSAKESAEKVANIAATASTDNTAKTVLVGTVTAERAKWRAEMRAYAEELIMLLRSSTRLEAVEWKRVDQLRSGIRLRLNPAGRIPVSAPPGRHERDRKLHLVLDDLQQAGKQGTGSHDAIADRFEQHMATMLKAEWEVSKGEAVNGTLAT